MAENMWNNALEYLKKSRKTWVNDDYMEFLVDRVWGIKTPVSIVDFGCGIGYLGELLMPILPKGSTYTGIDIGDKLLEEARMRFKDKAFETTFVEADLNDFVAHEKYDIAICQTVLQHIPNPVKILEKMKDSVKTNGMVICFELNRDVLSAATHIDGVDYGKLNLLGVEQKIRRDVREKSQKDFEIGLKIPVYLDKMGLRDVDVRVNDCVQFVNPSRSDFKQEMEAFMSGAYQQEMTESQKEHFVKNLMSNGLSAQEAEKMFEGHLEISDHLHDNQEALYIVNSNCMFISYGYK